MFFFFDLVLFKTYFKYRSEKNERNKVFSCKIICRRYTASKNEFTKNAQESQIAIWSEKSNESSRVY